MDETELLASMPSETVTDEDIPDQTPVADVEVDE